MQMIEARLPQRSSLPLPAAALVLDMRGVGNDDVIERLEIEIADLASEMRIVDIHHWRFLSDFLSFMSIDPMSPEEVETLRPKNQNAAANGHQTDTTILGEASPATSKKAGGAQSGLTGYIDPSTQKGPASPFLFQNEDDVASLNEDRPADILKQNILRMTQEINRIRNNRHRAVIDLDKTAASPNIKDATVRVIFLADAEHPDSLASTAVYAKHLKDFYREQERPGQQPMVSTTVLCLNNSGETAPSPTLKELLWEDRWDHLDSLIISEYYRQDAALITGSVQAYLAELLLYVLLIVPPLRVSSPATPSNAESSPPSSPQNGKRRNISLPPHTFLVGVAAMEHSARWGRRLLNYKVVERAIEEIQSVPEDEHQRTENTVASWLDNWCGEVRSAIPEHIPSNKITALEGISHATEATEQNFTVSHLGRGFARTTISDLEEHLTNLTQTYTSPKTPQARGTSRQQSSTSGVTLQGALDSVPQIQQRLLEWENKDLDLRERTPLAREQVEAERVLSHPAFFAGAHGAVPRAKLQLEELSTAISNFRTEHQQSSVNLLERQKELNDNGKKSIAALQHHVDSYPLLATMFRGAMVVLTVLLILFFGVVATFVGIAWLRHLLAAYNASGSRLALPDLLPVVDSILLSPFALLFWIIVLALVLTGFYFLGRRLHLFDRGRTAIGVEATFLFVLIVIALFGWATSFSVVALANDSESLGIASIAYLLYSWTEIIFITAIVLIIFVEILYFLSWYRYLRAERRRIVHKLNEEHKKNIADVTYSIGNEVALYLLMRAGLTNGRGGFGEYYQRVDQLGKRLRDILANARRQQGLAQRRLALSISKTYQGVVPGSQGIWLNLLIREELLNVESLADGYSRLTERLSQETEELKEFAELLLRVMGQETPAEVERDFRERRSQTSAEQHYAQVLMTTIAAMALRFSLTSTVGTMKPIIERYDAIENSTAARPLIMRSLIEALREKVAQKMIPPMTGGSMNPAQTEANAIATDAFAAWGQMLWEGKDPELEETLTADGVMPKLLENDSNSHLVRRLLGIRTSVFGRSSRPGQIGDLYLLLPPSQKSHLFRQSLNLPRRQITDFPDVERLLLLYVQHFVAEPLFLPEPQTPPPALPEADATSTQDSQSMKAGDIASDATAGTPVNGSAAAGTSSPVQPGVTVTQASPSISADATNGTPPAHSVNGPAVPAGTPVQQPAPVTQAPQRTAQAQPVVTPDPSAQGTPQPTTMVDSPLAQQGVTPGAAPDAQGTNQPTDPTNLLDPFDPTIYPLPPFDPDLYNSGEDDEDEDEDEDEEDEDEEDTVN